MANLLQHLLSESARRNPGKDALVCRGVRLTYGELEESSNRLARLLVERGVRPGDRVGLYFPKSVRSVVAMFGILKAGAAYVPVDPRTPARRVARILGDCGAKGVLATPANANVLDGAELPDHALEFVLLVEDAEVELPGSGLPALSWSSIEEMSDEPVPAAGFIESDLAYILYTSGSTGAPKGVMITHRNALAFNEWCAETFRVSADDRLSNHAPLHFDLSVFDVYNGIGAGATVFMVDEETVIFPSSLASFIEKSRITVWYSVPSALVQLLLHGNLAERSFASLRLVLYAGEPFPVKHLRELIGCLPGVEIYNLYGPTETNVCTYYRVPDELPEDLRQVPIGRPCENAHAVAVGDGGAPIAADGAEGELFVRGPTVTPGYWGDEEKTRRVIVENRDRPYLGDRVCRTGDIVTLDAEGNYHLRGRRDHMIKSRGYRIELGEIEAALYSHPAVVEAAAVAVPDEEIGNRIRAFAVVDADSELEAAALRNHCAQHIPHYMLPEQIGFLPQLPKTSTGKVDRMRLATERGA